MKERSVIAVEQGDWRLQGQDWLREELLRFERYVPLRSGSEHDHCEFCWTPFRTQARQGVLDADAATKSLVVARGVWPGDAVPARIMVPIGASSAGLSALPVTYLIT